MTTVVLMCAVIASLAGGVFLAYALCDAMFSIFRMHSLQVAQQRAAKRDAQQLATAAMDAAI